MYHETIESIVELSSTNQQTYSAFFFLKGVCAFHGFWARGFVPRKKIALQRLVSCRFCMWREKWQAWQPPYFVRGAVNLREANESAESLRVNGGISSRL